MACPTPIMIQESAFLDVLASATTYKIEGDEMELKDASGDFIAKFSLFGASIINSLFLAGDRV